MFSIFYCETGKRLSDREYLSADEANHDYYMNAGHSYIGIVTPPAPTDVEIDGHGFYAIMGASKQGKRWLNKHVQGFGDGVAYCDDSRLTRDVADGASSKGLRVVMNGRIYFPGGFLGECVA